MRTLAEHLPALVLAEGGAACESELLDAGYTGDELARLRQSHGILAWKDRFGGSHYPRWQFDKNSRVIPGVRRVLRIFRSRDTLYVLSQIKLRRGKKPSILQLIRQGRDERAADVAQRQARADKSEPPLSSRWRKELARRLAEMKDPVRHVVVSGLLGKRALVYDFKNHCYGWGHVSETCLVKDRAVAVALARHLSGGRKNRAMQVLRVRPFKRSIRTLGAIRGTLGQRTFVPRLGRCEPVPSFVPITRPGSRERAIDVRVFALENQDRLLPLIQSAGNGAKARATLMRRCLLSRSEAGWVLDLRFVSTTKDCVGQLRAKLRGAFR